MTRLSKRMVWVFAAFCILFFGLNLRMAYLQNSESLQQAAVSQRSYTLDVGITRGQIYDRNLLGMVNQVKKTQAAILPMPENTQAVLNSVLPQQRSSVLEQLKNRLPFVTTLTDSTLKMDGVTLIPTVERYPEKQLAAHVLGYVNGDGEGVSGIEKAYNDYLKQAEKTVQARYTLDGLGNPIGGTQAEVLNSGEVNQGVVLTIDQGIQQICEEVGKPLIDKGAIVVMDPYTGELLACASFPEYSPNHVEKSLNDEDAPLINRCFSAFTVGSTFKTVLCAAALKQGISPDLSYDCIGWINVKGQPFKCHYLPGHGQIDMKTAMVESCNTYFISLGQTLGAQSIYQMAKDMSFGQGYELAPGLYTAAGNLPTAAQMPNPADVANISFGQGTLTATPVQLCQMISCVVNDGKTPVPQLVKGLTADGVTMLESYEPKAPVYAVDAEITQIIKGFLDAAVNEKDGIAAKPEHVTAAGKTGTAQTGKFKEDGTEIVDTWFAGYFPKEEPKYVVSVLVQDGSTGNLSAGPVFAEIADKVTAYLDSGN